MLKSFSRYVFFICFYCMPVYCYAEKTEIKVSDEVLRVLDELAVSASAKTVAEFLKPFSTEFTITEMSKGKVVGTWDRESAIANFSQSNSVITDYNVTREIISTEAGTKDIPGTITCRTKEELNFNGKDVTGETVEKISFIRVDGTVKIRAISYEIQKKANKD